MNIGNGNFKILSPSQANPGISMMSRIIAQHLQNQAMQSRTQGQDLMNQRSAATLPYAGPQAAADLQARNLSNEWYAPEKRALIAQANASTQNTLAQTIAQKIQNQYLPQMNQQKLTSGDLANQLAKAMMPLQVQQAGANVAGTNLQNQAAQATLPYAGPQAAAQEALTDAQAKYYGQNGGPGAQRNVNMQHLNNLYAQVSKDNPNLNGDPDKVRDAVNAIAKGQYQLADGTILNKPSFTTSNAMGVYSKDPTTAGLITQTVRADQAAAEIPALTSVIEKYTTPYADTLFGKSPKQIMASFSSNPDDQVKLGQFAGAQALQYELAQIRNKQVGGEAGEKATQELMGRSNQLIDAWYPKMSAAGRKATMDTIQEGLDAAFNARKDVGINADQTLQGYDSTNQNNKNSQPTPQVSKPQDKKEIANKVAALAKLYPNLPSQHLADVAGGNF